MDDEELIVLRLKYGTIEDLVREIHKVDKGGINDHIIHSWKSSDEYYDGSIWANHNDYSRFRSAITWFGELPENRRFCILANYLNELLK